MRSTVLPVERPQRSWSPDLMHAVLFFVVIPLLIGVMLGATRAGVAQFFPWSIGVLFWVASTLAVWACLYGGSALAGVLLRPWQPPLWVILLTGAVIGSLPARYLVFLTAGALGNQMQGGRTPQTAPGFELSLDFWVYYLQVWAGAYLAWVVIGLVFDRWAGFPRYSRAAVTATAISPSSTVEQESVAAVPVAAAAMPSSFLDRLPEKIGRHVIALEAEDHYVRVHTDLGSTLVLARLSDAIDELGVVEGLRVHRSYWVRKNAVQKVSANGKGFLLRLSNGMDVPVSQGYKELVRQSGVVS